MPLYSYRCPNEHVFDVFRSMDSIPNYPTDMCPECGMESRRLFNSQGTGIIRPKGWSLKPDDKGYYDFDPEIEKRVVDDWLRQQPREEEQ